MKKINANVMLVLGAMLIFILQTSSFSQVDTSRTGTGENKTGTSTTPGTDRTGTSTMPGTTNRTGTVGVMGDTSGRASMYYSQAETITNDLKTRLNLTADQTSEIRDILIDYRSDLNEQKMAGTDKTGVDKTGTDRSSQVGGTKDQSDLQQTANERIESVLNDSQKQQFSSLQTEWWNKVNTQFNTGTDKSKTNSDWDKNKDQKQNPKQDYDSNKKDNSDSDTK